MIQVKPAWIRSKCETTESLRGGSMFKVPITILMTVVIYLPLPNLIASLLGHLEERRAHKGFRRISSTLFWVVSQGALTSQLVIHDRDIGLLEFAQFSEIVALATICPHIRVWNDSLISFIRPNTVSPYSQAISNVAHFRKINVAEIFDSHENQLHWALSKSAWAFLTL